MKRKTILLIDDDVDLVSMLKTFLEIKGLNVLTAYNSQEIPYNLDEVHLVLLDINMPREDGFIVCKHIREKWNMPILFLSARINEEDKIKGLMLGGDDYITKPFSLDELYARIYTNISRNERNQSGANNYVIQNGLCFINDIEIPLTKAEYEIVDLLASYPKQVFSKERMYDTLWGYSVEGDPQVVAEHVRNIRNKIKQVSDKEYIKTHWGLGYSWIG